jgi:EVE domain
MGLTELTSRDAVLQAIEEFDALGREAFLEKYGFGQARDFFIRADDRLYDSKAIAGVAYGNQFPDRGPLKSTEFSGGDATVRQVLERLGFEIHVLAHDRPSAWIFQANPSFFDLEGAAQNLTNLSWLVKQHREDILSGDTVYLWEGGSNAGVVTVAKVTGAPAMRHETAEESRFNRDATKFAGEKQRVLLRIERVLNERISRTELLQHPILNNMTILRAPQGTNFALSLSEFRALDALIREGLCL